MGVFQVGEEDVGVDARDGYVVDEGAGRNQLACRGGFLGDGNKICIKVLRTPKASQWSDMFGRSLASSF